MLKFNVKKPDIQGMTSAVNERYKRVLMKSMFKMEELVLQDVPVDRGGLKQGITLFPQVLSHSYFLSSRAPYSAAIEYGTRPFYAPIKPLKDWARRVIGDEDVAYAVQKKIANEGITAQPFMRPAFHKVEIDWVKKFMKEEFG